METKTTIQFDVLDTEMLASIEGGTASAGEASDVYKRQVQGKFAH